MWNRSLSPLLALLSLAALTAQPPGAPVLFDGVTLWTLTQPRANFSPAQRAEDVRLSLLALAGDPRRDLADLIEIQAPGESILLVDRVYLFAVTETDARAAGRPLPALFAERRDLALQAVQRYRAARSLQFYTRAALLSLAALLLGALALWLLRLLYRRTRDRLQQASNRFASHSHGLARLFRSLERQLMLLARASLRSLFLLLAATVGLASLSFVLGLFPATATVSESVLLAASQTGRLAAAAILAYLPNLLLIAVVFALTYILLKIAAALSRAIDSGAVTIPRFHREWAQTTYGLTRLILILFALVVVFPYLPGGDSPALRGVSLFIGVLVSLGSGSAMGNAIAGLILTYMRPFQLGDRVKIADTLGDVTEKAMLVTRIRTIKNVEVIVPNSAILGAHIINYSTNAHDLGLILSTTVTIGYDAPWRRVRELLVHAALETPGVLPDPAPFVQHLSLNDFHVSYELNAYTRDPHRMAAIYSELHKNIQDAFHEGGIEIMSPGYLALRDGNTITIPPSQRSPAYTPPAFRVQSQPPAQP
jgi:small-conductance mechanosensitive channel